MRRKASAGWGVVLCGGLVCKQVGLRRLLLVVPANLTLPNLGKAAQTQRFPMEGRKALQSQRAIFRSQGEILTASMDVWPLLLSYSFREGAILVLSLDILSEPLALADLIENLILPTQGLQDIVKANLDDNKKGNRRFLSVFLSERVKLALHSAVPMAALWQSVYAPALAGSVPESPLPLGEVWT